MIAALLLAATLNDAEIIRGFVNLARLNRLGFALKYRLIQYGDLEIGTSLHERAVALQLRDEELVDPWETPYRIEISGKNVRVTGAGADRKFEPDDAAIQGRVKTSSITTDVIWSNDHVAQGNYTWLFLQVGKPPSKHPGLYAPPVFEPIHRRQPNKLPATPDDARSLELEAEMPVVFPRFGDMEVIRVMQTRASMELLAARLEAWHAKHGSYTADMKQLKSEAWPYNDWLLPIDQWGTPFRLEIGSAGYILTSLGADQRADATPVAGISSNIDQVMENGKFTRGFDSAAYEAELQRRDEEQARKPRPPTVAADGTTIWRVGGDVTAPVATHQVDPLYPADALKQKIGGLCIIEAIIDEQGNVIEAKLLMAENEQLGNAALDAVRQWKFKPAIRNGVPVRVFYNLTISFNPRD